MTMRREEGWYWCVMDGALFPIYFSGGAWWKGGHKLWEEPRIISGRIPTPEEPWAYVPVEPTPDMLFALDSGRAAYGSMRGGYRAMLEAARRAPDGP